MRRLVIVFACILLPLAALPARDLKKEWKEYERIARKDRPRDQIAKLHEIRALAIEFRLPDDLFRACRREEGIHSRMNWKSTDSLHQALLEVVESYGDPMLVYRWLNGDWEYARTHRAEFEAGYHPASQGEWIPFLQTREEDDIRSDFEWILWDRVYTNQQSKIPDSEEYRLLDSLIGDRFPARPYLSYLTALKAEDRLSAMQALAKQYAGTSFRFIPEYEVLKERWNRLKDNQNASEADFKTLYDDVRAFIKAEKAEKGVNKRKQLSLDDIQRKLTSPELSIDFKNDSIVLIGRNFGDGELAFNSDEYHRDVRFRHRNDRFYVRDTVKIPIPVLPDGKYNVLATYKYGAVTSYQKHTLSLAVRRQGEDFAVYVADYKTGEPLPSATIRLIDKKGKKVLEQEIPLNGFTPLPTDFQKKLGKKAYTLEARVGERRSSSIRIFKLAKAEETPPATLHARVFKDRGAYRPGDTLKAKAVLFEGDLHKEVKALPKGRDVQVRIFNAERKKLADIALKTNPYGSVCWEWPIPEGERNGNWDIEVVYQEKTLHRSSFRVDDFVLPTFEVTFDPQEKPFLPETRFEVSGKVVSYSGHPVDGITLEGVVTRYRREVWSGPVSIDRDGAFKIPLLLKDRGEYTLNIKALDATGETLDFEHTFQVSDALSMAVELKNKASGDFSYRGSKLEEAVLTESVARFAWTVKSSGEPVRLPVTYRLVDVDGKVFREGTSDDTLDMDLSDCPDGLYVLQGTVLFGKAHTRVDLPIMKVTSGPVGPVRSVFLTGETEIEYGERIRARLGAGDGPLWAVATLAAPDGSILESRLVHLDGTGELSNLEFTYKGTYPDAVRLEVFYFRDSDQVAHEGVYHRIRHTMELPLTFSRFEDRTRPGAPYTLSLQTEPGVEAAVAVYDKSLDSMEPNGWKAVKPLPPTFWKTWSQSIAGIVFGEKIQNLRAEEARGPVWGVVLDEYGEPIIGAAVIVKGTPDGATTDVV